MVRWTFFQAESEKQMFVDFDEKEEKDLKKEIKKFENYMFVDCGETQTVINMDQITFIHRDPRVKPEPVKQEANVAESKPEAID